MLNQFLCTINPISRKLLSILRNGTYVLLYVARFRASSRNHNKYIFHHVRTVLEAVCSNCALLHLAESRCNEGIWTGRTRVLTAYGGPFHPILSTTFVTIFHKIASRPHAIALRLFMHFITNVRSAISSAVHTLLPLLRGV